MSKSAASSLGLLQFDNAVRSLRELTLGYDALGIAIRTASTQDNFIANGALALVGYTAAVNESAAAYTQLGKQMTATQALVFSNTEATKAMAGGDIAATRATKELIAAKQAEASALAALGVVKASTGVAGSLGALGGAAISAGGALAATGMKLTPVTKGLSLLITLLGAGVAAWGMFKETIKKILSLFVHVLKPNFGNYIFNFTTTVPSTRIIDLIYQAFKQFCQTNLPSENSRICQELAQFVKSSI
jgi:hypothetical protein